MSERVLSCPSCGYWTEAGKENLRQRARAHPIYGTDLSRPLSEIIEGIRRGIADLRGQLGDVKFAFGWDDRLDTPMCGLTLVLIALHGVAQEMKRIEAE